MYGRVSKVLEKWPLAARLKAAVDFAACAARLKPRPFKTKAQIGFVASR
jgi:hypothetical protein